MATAAVVAAPAAAVAAAAAAPVSQTTRVTSRQVSLPRAGSKALNCNLVGLLLLVAFAASLLVSVQLAGQAVLAPLALLRGPGGGGGGGQQVHLQVVRGGDYGPPTLDEEPAWEARSLGVGAAAGAGSASSRVQEEGASGGGGSGSGSLEGDGLVTGVGHRQGVGGERASKEISKEDVAVPLPPGVALDVLADAAAAAAADLARSSDKNGDEESSSSGGFGLLVEAAGSAAAAAQEQQQQGNNGGEDAKTSPRNVTKDDDSERRSHPGGTVLQLAAEEETTTTGAASVVDTTSSTSTSRSDEPQVIREITGEDRSNSELIPIVDQPAVAAADVHDAAGDSSTTNNNNLTNETVQELLSQQRTTSESDVVVVNGTTQPRSSNVGSTDDDSSAAAAAAAVAALPPWRRRTEDELKAAKLALQDPAFSVPDDSSSDALHAPAYHNATHFRKSYHLMEQVFKTYVYAEGNPPLVHAGPLTGIYASEGQFISAMHHMVKTQQAQGQQGTTNNRLVTRDPHAAHMFFLPYSVAHMVEHLYVPGSRSMQPLSLFVTDYVTQVAAAHPFWNMSAGRDHFLVACHDWGPATARDHPELRANAVKVVCNADLTEEFVPGKDASLPEVYLHKRPRSRRRKGGAAAAKAPTATAPAAAVVAYDTVQFGGNPPAERRVLAFFAGQMHGRVRPVLLRHWKDSDPDMQIYELIPRAVAKKTPYAAHMKRSRFCVCAAGYEVNSPRLVEAIYYDCVPVIVADHFVLPFSDVLDWSTFSLTVAEKDIPDLKRILLAVSDRRYRDMQARLRHVRKHFVWHPGGPPQKYDAFHMVMHSVWMRRLAQVQV